MKTAATDAKFCTKATDSIYLVREPEAAVYAALKSRVNQVDEFVQVGPGCHRYIKASLTC